MSPIQWHWVALVLDGSDHWVPRVNDPIYASGPDAGSIRSPVGPTRANPSVFQGATDLLAILRTPMARTKRRRGTGFLRVLNMLPFLPLAGRAPTYARLLWALASDSRVPPSRKALLGLAGAYILSPIDLIPEAVPIFGAMDDVAVMVIAIDVFLEGLPKDLVNEKLADLGMSPSELEQDLARVRRMVPRSVRSAVGRVPDAIDSVGEFFNDTGLDRRVRATVARFRGPETQEYNA